jgi:competence protein ComEA
LDKGERVLESLQAHMHGRQLIVAVAGLAAVALVAGYGVSMRSRPKPLAVDLGSPRPSASAGASTGDGFYVDVAGAVARPGLYRLAPGSRVDDAIKLAGGPTAEADLDALNLASKVKDGDKILVPKRGATGAGSGDGAATTASGQSQQLNLNTATADQLDALPGIGPALAQRIIAYREQHGGFRTVDELQKVPGIGPAKFGQIKDLVTV